MQTFLPYADFVMSARALDYRRLGKQRVECKQIIQAMDRGTGWASHPCTHMWTGYQYALAKYGAAICREWRARGYQDSLLGYFREVMRRPTPNGEVRYPPWLGYEPFHASHRSNLLRKEPNFYNDLWAGQPPTLPYLWHDRHCGWYSLAADGKRIPHKELKS